MNRAANYFLAAVAGLALVFCFVDYHQQPNELFSINLEDATFGGNGCPEGSVQIVSSPDEKTISVLFSEYIATTDLYNLRVRKSCNLALPVRVPPGICLGIFQVDLLPCVVPYR